MTKSSFLFPLKLRKFRVQDKRVKKLVNLKKISENIPSLIHPLELYPQQVDKKSKKFVSCKKFE